MTTPRRFSYVVGLVNLTGRRVTVFDLETAGFMNTKNQGITEVACFTVAPEANGYVYGSLLNPGCPISPGAKNINGLSDADVKNEQHFTEKFSGLFDTIANEHTSVVWNGKSFDCRYIIRVETEKGMPARKFNHVLDVMVAFAKLENSGAPCKLVEACNKLGIDTESVVMHRAAGDVALTTEVLDVLLEKHGTAVLKFIAPLDPVQSDAETKPAVEAEKPAKPSKKEESKPVKIDKTAILDYFKNNQYPGIAALATHLEYPAAKLEFALSQYLDAGDLSAMELSEDEVIDWLVPALETFPSELLQGQLKPIKAALEEKYPGKELSYLQLRVGLYYGGFR